MLLTAKGVAKAKEVDPSRENCKYVKDSDYMRRRRDDMYATAKATMIACGIVVSGAKMPHLEIIANQNASTEERDTEITKFNNAAEKGLFLSAATIRAACQLFGEQAEYIAGTRLLGILVIKSSILYVYNVKKFIINLFPNREKKTILTIERVLARITGICVRQEAQDAVDRPQMQRCVIVFATEKSMLVKIYRGDKLGKDNSSTTTRQKNIAKQNWKTVHATFKTLQVLFNPIYFTTCDKEGARLLKRLQNSIVYGKNPNQDILDRMDLIRDSETSYASYDPDGNRDVVPLGWLDMEEMDSYIQEGIARNRKYTVVGSKYFVDPISRCFGETIKEYLDSSTMKSVPILHYNNSGLRMGEYPIDHLLDALEVSKEKKGQTKK